MTVDFIPDIFDKNPALAYAILGFADGKSGNKADPPKGKYHAVYMREFLIGLQQRK